MKDKQINKDIMSFAFRLVMEKSYPSKEISITIFITNIPTKQIFEIIVILYMHVA